MTRYLLALLFCWPAVSHAASNFTDQRRTSVNVDFRIVIPPRHYSRQINNLSTPLDRGQERIVERLPNGLTRITLVWP